MQMILPDIANFLAVIANIRCSCSNVNNGCYADKFAQLVAHANLFVPKANVSNDW